MARKVASKHANMGQRVVAGQRLMQASSDIFLGWQRAEAGLDSMPRRERPWQTTRSLEVRWIFPGRLGTDVVTWFARFPATTESREDNYLLDPYLPGLSVKVRGGAALELKAYCGSPGTFELPGRARGRLQTWRKWSFPCSLPGLGDGAPPSWQPVRKTRHISRFPAAGEPAVASNPAPCPRPPCAVELTEIRTRGQDWWTLGFETTGPGGLLRSELLAVAALVFARAIPGGVKPGLDQCRSYAEWLSPQSAEKRAMTSKGSGPAGG
jgi:hypothetical protein